VKLEHLGIAVRDVDEAVALFTTLLGSPPYKEETVDREHVRTVFYGDGGAAGRAPKIELVGPTDAASPVTRFLERRGPGLHHVAFEVDDLTAAMARLRAAGFQPIGDESAGGADGKRVAFIHPRSAGGVLVEVVESSPAVEKLYVDVDGGRLAAFVSGPANGEPLVVLHGALGSTAMETERLTRRWSSDFRVVAVDFRGHGASGGGGPLSIEGLFEDVLAVADAAGVENAHLFGYSLGSAVALYTAWRRPERVRRVAILGTNVRWVDDEARAMTGVMSAALDAPEGRWARRLAACHGDDRWRDLTEQTIAFTRGLPGRPFADESLRSITTPVLIAHGDRDRYFDLRHAIHLRRTLPNSRLWVIPGADHAIRKLDATSFASDVAAFYRGFV
jgi:methylmalonyl-CoA epimerase